MTRTIPLMERLHAGLGRSRWLSRLALLVRNQSQAVVKHRLMTGHDVRESGEEWLIRTLQGQIRYFVDVGANRGEWSALVMAHNPGCSGLILEPGPAAVALLHERFDSEPRISVLAAAASDHEKANVPFFEQPGAGATSSLSRATKAPQASEVSVAQVTLDAELSRRGWPGVDLLKIDTEGYDLHVLRGSVGLLAHGSAAIVQWEYGDGWPRAGSTLAAALALMESHDYRTYLLKRDGLYRYDYDLFGEYFTFSNFVSLRRDLVERFDPTARTLF